MADALTQNSGGSLNPLAGLRVAITGGTSGLGAALVDELLNRRAQVAFVARGRERIERARCATGRTRMGSRGTFPGRRIFIQSQCRC